MNCFVVADDLTGANDTGSVFAARGYRTSVARSIETIPEIGGATTGMRDEATRQQEISVGVVNTDSRYVDTDTAHERVGQAIDAASPGVVYNKIDSTLRGNLVAEVEASVEAAEADIAVIAPAFPATGRLTAGGYHLVRGTPVFETAAGRDRNGPATSHLPSLFDDSAYSVVHCPLETVADGTQLRERLDQLATEGEPTLVVCDATTESHLSTIAHAANQSAATPVYVGSAGLADHISLKPANEVLGVVGSVASETLEQLTTVPSDRVVKFDPVTAIRDAESAVNQAVTALRDTYRDGTWAVVTAATDRSDVEAARGAGRKAGLDDSATGERVADVLATVVSDFNRGHELDGLFVTGGEVANTTFDALDVDVLQHSGHQIAAGVPVTVAAGGAADGLVCVTKAGAFGDDMTILNALHSLTSYHG